MCRSIKTIDKGLHDLDARYGDEVVWRAYDSMVAVASEMYDEISTFKFWVFHYRWWYR